MFLHPIRNCISIHMRGDFKVLVAQVETRDTETDP